MSVKVRLPEVIKSITGTTETVCRAGTIRDIVEELNFFYPGDEKTPGFKNRIMDDKGKVRIFINIYKNNEFLYRDGLEEIEVKDNDELSFIAAVSGG